MPRRHRRAPKSPPPRSVPRIRARPPLTFLDLFTVDDIERWKSLRDKWLQFHWDYYSNLARQRSLITAGLKGALLGAAAPCKLERWQRIVKYKYALEPLSPAGSLADVGGRFNIGDINPTYFPPFPALYLASDKPTALKESLGQDHQSKGELTPLDLALTKGVSIANVSLSGNLDHVIDLRKPETLRGFVDLIKGFTLPAHLAQTAREARLEPPTVVTSVGQLLRALLDPNWRQWPMLYDVPVSSQIFGQLARDAGIEGVVYPSKFPRGTCVAVFPENLAGGSFVALDDEPPPGNRFRRLDADSWREMRKTF